MEHTKSDYAVLELHDYLPEGYVSRPARMEDLDAVIETINAATRDLIGGDKFTVSDYKIDWEQPAFNLDTGTRLVISPEGEVAGIYEFWDIVDPYVRFVVWGRVHPHYEGRGIGSHMLEWVERRAVQSLEKSPPGARVVLHGFIPSIIQGADALFVDNGYTLIRHSLRMVIDLNGVAPVPQWPQGIKVRSLGAEEDITQVVHAVRESFKDHWGYVEGSFEEDYDRWMHRIQNDEHYHPSLWFLAMDGDEIAGISLCWSQTYDDPDMAWVGTLGVRRPWRRQGLGLALLQHSFAEFCRLGKPRAGLGVDAQNLTGAMRLYTKAGMRSDPRHQHGIYEKELRPGFELATQTVEG